MITCLLVDDDEDDREIFGIAIQEVGVPVDFSTATNGKAALQRLSNGAFVPDIIFMDINMPLMTGVECLAAIRSLRHLAAVPVYMYTTSAGTRDNDDLLALGAAGVIIKPAIVSELVRQLKAVLPSH